MWPFARRSEPDPLLEGVKKGVIATLAAHGALLEQLQRALNDLRTDIAHAVAIDKRVQRAEHSLASLDRFVADQVNRIDASIVQVRGLATGATRKPRGDAAAAQVGEKLIAAMSDPALRAELIAELQGIDAGRPNGADHPAGM